MYLISSALTIALLVIPLLAADNPTCTDGLLTQFTPEIAHRLVQGWCANPQWVLILGSLLLATTLYSLKVKANTDQHAEFAWQHLRSGNRGKPGPEPSVFEWLSGRLRKQPTAVRWYRFLTNWVSPYLALVALLYCLAKWGVPAIWGILQGLAYWVSDGLVTMLHWLPLL